MLPSLVEKKISNNKAPSSDQILNRYIKATIPTLSAYLIPLFQGCLKLGHFPRSFKELITIALKKGGDSRDYSKPNSWRPIALLSSLGKLLEAIIARRLTLLAEKY